MNSPLLCQAIIFGVITTLIGLLFFSLFSFLKPTIRQGCDEFDKFYIIEIVLFFTGVILRYLLIVDYIKPFIYN
jgi:hypothetical protein